MKLKTTKKQIQNNSNKVLKIGYCELQTLLRYKNAFAYSAGSYGWACDYYEIDNVIISTGYQPIGEKVDYKLIKVYEKQAQKIAYNNDFSYDRKVQQLDNLCTNFVKMALKNIIQKYD